jgi:hypothetical protein
LGSDVRQQSLAADQLFPGRARLLLVDQNLPVARQVIETQSANMHMIPADAEIESRLKFIRPGNMVHLKGILVEVVSKEGWRWKRSLTRNDTGGGACELILVESLYVW